VPEDDEQERGADLFAAADDDATLSAALAAVERDDDGQGEERCPSAARQNNAPVQHATATLRSRQKHHPLRGRARD